MGKAAHNEKLKFKATFWNNIAVGIMVTGYVIPLFAVTAWFYEALAQVPKPEPSLSFWNLLWSAVAAVPDLPVKLIILLSIGCGASIFAILTRALMVDPTPDKIAD